MLQRLTVILCTEVAFLGMHGPLWAILLGFVAPPLANEIVLKVKGTRAESLIQGIALFVLKVPAVGFLVAKVPGIGDALYVLAPKDKGDLPVPLFAKPTRVAVPAIEITVNTNEEAPRDPNS